MSASGEAAAFVLNNASPAQIAQAIGAALQMRGIYTIAGVPIESFVDPSGGQGNSKQEQVNQQLQALEGLDPMAYSWGRRVFVGVAAISSGAIVTGATFTGQVSLCLYSGPLCVAALPGTIPTMGGGLYLMKTGWNYLRHGLPNSNTAVPQ